MKDLENNKLINGFVGDAKGYKIIVHLCWLIKNKRIIVYR